MSRTTSCTSVAAINELARGMESQCRTPTLPRISPQFDPKDVDYLEAKIASSYGAELGDRTYGVFNIVPRSALNATIRAELGAQRGKL